MTFVLLHQPPSTFLLKVGDGVATSLACFYDPAIARRAADLLNREGLVDTPLTAIDDGADRG